jgi:hypothetical protein
MLTKFSRFLVIRFAWTSICFFLLAASAHAQAEINLKGAIDFRVHSAPDSNDRSIDADDVAQLAKDAGMRAIVLKNHWETTATLAYEVRKHVPGIEVFGGVVLNNAMGGINLDAIQHMAALKGGYGKVVWMPTFDSENFLKKSGDKRPPVVVSKEGHLLPEVVAVIDFIAKNPQLVLETGDVSADEGVMIVHEAHQRGVRHIVVTNPRGIFPDWTEEQMKQAAADGAYLEFIYNAIIGSHPQRSIAEYAANIRHMGPEHCVLGTDMGSAGPNAPKFFHPEGLLKFMQALQQQGFTVAEINTMAKTNPAIALGLAP